jgi:hypothetical protein
VLLIEKVHDRKNCVGSKGEIRKEKEPQILEKETRSWEKTSNTK